MSGVPTVPGALIFPPNDGLQRVPVACRLGRRLPMSLRKDDPKSGTPLPLLPCPFHHLWFASQTAVPFVDSRSGTTVVSGVQHIVRPGEGAVLVMMLVWRRADLSREQFVRRWLNGHSKVALRVSSSGYRQLHASGPESPDAFDGAGLVFFRDLDHMAAVRASPEVAHAATLDEMAFVDHSRSMLAAFELSPG